MIHGLGSMCVYPLLLTVKLISSSLCNNQADSSKCCPPFQHKNTSTGPTWGPHQHSLGWVSQWIQGLFRKMECGLFFWPLGCWLKEISESWSDVIKLKRRPYTCYLEEKTHFRVTLLGGHKVVLVVGMFMDWKRAVAAVEVHALLGSGCIQQVHFGWLQHCGFSAALIICLLIDFTVQINIVKHNDRITTVVFSKWICRAVELIFPSVCVCGWVFLSTVGQFMQTQRLCSLHWEWHWRPGHWVSWRVGHRASVGQSPCVDWCCATRNTYMYMQEETCTFFKQEAEVGLHLNSGK